MFLVRKNQENFETALCGAIENGSFQNYHKKSLQPRTKVLRHFNAVFNCLVSKREGPGARFSKLQVITGPVKLFCFPLRMGVSKVLKMIQ